MIAQQGNVVKILSSRRSLDSKTVKILQGVVCRSFRLGIFMFETKLAGNIEC